MGSINTTQRPVQLLNIIMLNLTSLQILGWAENWWWKLKNNLRGPFRTGLPQQPQFSQVPQGWFHFPCGRQHHPWLWPLGSQVGSWVGSWQEGNFSFVKGRSSHIWSLCRLGLWRTWSPPAWCCSHEASRPASWSEFGEECFVAGPGPQPGERRAKQTFSSRVSRDRQLIFAECSRGWHDVGQFSNRE